MTPDPKPAAGEPTPEMCDCPATKNAHLFAHGVHCSYSVAVQKAWDAKNAAAPSPASSPRKDEDIDLSDIPEVTDWSNAVRGKFYREKPEGERLGTCDHRGVDMQLLDPHPKLSGCVNWQPIAPEAAPVIRPLLPHELEQRDKLNKRLANRPRVEIDPRDIGSRVLASDYAPEAAGGEKHIVKNRTVEGGKEFWDHVEDVAKNLQPPDLAPAAPSGEQNFERSEPLLRWESSREIDGHAYVLLAEATSILSTLRRERDQWEKLATNRGQTNLEWAKRAETAESQLRELTAERERLLKNADEMCKYEAELRSTIETLKQDLRNARAVVGKPIRGKK